MFIRDVIDILWNYRDGFLSGLAVTMQMSLIIWFVGLLVGSGLGILSARQPKTLGVSLRWVSFILSGVPTLVFLFWLHYPAQAAFNLVIDPFITATFTFVLLNVIAVNDIVRYGIEEMPSQYVTAAQVCGLPNRQIVWHIQLPLIIRQILPSLLMLQVNMLHLTLFASLISVEEIFRVAQRINASIYKPVEIYTALGVFFLMVCLPINGLALYLKKKYLRNLSEK